MHQATCAGGEKRSVAGYQGHHGVDEERARRRMVGGAESLLCQKHNTFVLRLQQQAVHLNVRPQAGPRSREAWRLYPQLTRQATRNGGESRSVVGKLARYDGRDRPRLVAVAPTIHGCSRGD